MQKSGGGPNEVDEARGRSLLEMVFGGRLQGGEMGLEAFLFSV